MKTKVDLLIIGGGVVGLMCAYKIKKIFPKRDVILIEKENYLGDHSTSRSSCVLHSGLYYPTNSLKHIHCIEGHRQWLDIANNLKVPVNLCGKYIITNNKNDPSLERLYAQAMSNGVNNIEYIDSSTKRSLKEYLYLEDAIYSKCTGIIDIGDALKKVRHQFEAHGGIILNSHEVSEIERKSQTFKIVMHNKDVTFDVETNVLVNSSGLFAIDIREKLHLNDLQNYYVKGNYLRISPDPKYTSLIYPLPSKDLSNLGIHSTIDFAGRNRFGPSYHPCDEVNYSMKSQCIEDMYESISKSFKNIELNMLNLDYCGIRPKIKNSKGEILKDFIFNTKDEHGIENYYEFLGIDSPGLTAAPSLADRLMSTLLKSNQV